MTLKLTKWGNSFGIRIPKNILDELSIKENDNLEIIVKNNQIILRKNEYDEFNIREMAESYYNKPFSQLESVLSNKESEWIDAQGEEEW